MNLQEFIKENLNKSDAYIGAAAYAKFSSEYSITEIDLEVSGLRRKSSLTLTEITLRILNESFDCMKDEFYQLTPRAELNEKSILSDLKLLTGYSHENDLVALGSFLRATPLEKWEYYLKTILPNIRKEGY